MKLILALAAFAAEAFGRHGNHFNFEQLVMQAGYIAESYTIVTDDGYIE